VRWTSQEAAGIRESWKKQWDPEGGYKYINIQVLDV
jgi:hypothetical protein